MKRSRFSEEQIIAILKEQEAGVPTGDVCRRHVVSSATFYKWKAKFGGLEVSEAKFHINHYSLYSDTVSFKLSSDEVS